jgi:hypothetical protein
MAESLVLAAFVIGLLFLLLYAALLQKMLMATERIGEIMRRCHIVELMAYERTHPSEGPVASNGLDPVQPDEKRRPLATM